MPTRWTSAQLEYLEKNYHKNDISDLIKIIGRTEDAIRWKASQLGYLLRDGRNHSPIRKITVGVTQEHYDYLKSHKFNQSDVIRKALDLYLKSNK